MSQTGLCSSEFRSVLCQLIPNIVWFGECPMGAIPSETGTCKDTYREWHYSVGEPVSRALYGLDTPDLALSYPTACAASVGPWSPGAPERGAVEATVAHRKAQLNILISKIQLKEKGPIMSRLRSSFAFTSPSSSRYVALRHVTIRLQRLQLP